MHERLIWKPERTLKTSFLKCKNQPQVNMLGVDFFRKICYYKIKTSDNMIFNVLGLELTNACPNRCKYCYNEDRLMKGNMSKDLIYKALTFMDN